MPCLQKAARAAWCVTIFIAAGFTAAKTPPAPVPHAAAASAALDYSKEAWVDEKLTTDIVFQADGTNRREQASVVRVQSAEGVRHFGLLTIPYDAGLEKVERVEVRVRKPDGTLIVTPDSNIQDLPAEVSRAAPMYSDLREKQVPVKSLGVGDMLEFRVLWVRTKTDIPGQFWYSQSFTNDGVVLNETVRIDVPTDKYVQVLSPEAAPAITQNDGRKVYIWQYTQLEPVRQSQKPQPKRQKPEPVRPSIQITTFQSWEELGRWFGPLFAKQAVGTPAVQAKAAELTRSLTSDFDKQRAIYNYVATKFRYISISFGDGRYQPHTAEEVLNNQYGDCKDKHTLFAALMNAAGFATWPALISAGGKLEPELPSPGQFNHVITVLPAGKEVVWLDTTNGVAPWAALMPVLRDQQALVIPDSGPARLMTTPADLPFPSVQHFSVKGSLTDDGTFTGHLEVTARGDTEMILRTLFRQTEPASWQQLVQNLSNAWGFGGTVTNVDVEELENPDEPFHCSYDYERKKYSDWENLRITPPLPRFMLPFGEGDAEPNEPIEMSSPGEIVFSASMHLPKGYSAQLPDNVKFDNVYCAYSATFEQKDGVLTVERRLSVKKSKIPVSGWSDYLALFKSIRTDTERWILLSSGRPGEAPLMSQSNQRAAELVRQGWQALHDRDSNVARDALEQAERLNPKEPGVQGLMGSLFMMEKQREKGYERLKREIANNPGNYPFYNVLAQEQLSDHHQDEALETLRSLLRLKPADIQAVSQFARILISAKRYQEALPAVETALKTAPDNSDLQVLQTRILVKSGRKEEGVAVARKLGDQATDSATLNEVAWALANNGVELPLARQYSAKSISILENELKDLRLSKLTDEDLRRIVLLSAEWDTLGWAYFRSGELSKAEAWLNAAWILAQGGDVGDHLGQLYERQGKRDAAIHMYQLALVANSGMDETRERLKKLGGSPEPKPRVTNGKTVQPVRPVSPVEELQKLRSNGIPELGKRTGIAEFFILFSAHKVEDVQFISGAEKLMDATEALLKAHYKMPFPDDGPEKVARRGYLSCSQYTTPSCSFVFWLPANTQK
jgi:tetratricopeptide (TPR) repeat protein